MQGREVKSTSAGYVWKLGTILVSQVSDTGGCIDGVSKNTSPKDGKELIY